MTSISRDQPSKRNRSPPYWFGPRKLGDRHEKETCAEAMASTHASTDVDQLGAVETAGGALVDSAAIEAIVSTVAVTTNEIPTATTAPTTDDVLRLTTDAAAIAETRLDQPTTSTTTTTPTIVRILAAGPYTSTPSQPRLVAASKTPANSNLYTIAGGTATTTTTTMTTTPGDIDDFSDFSSDDDDDGGGGGMSANASSLDQSDLLVDSNDVTVQLAAAGPVGVAAAAAVATTRKRRHNDETYTFETNPSVRRRQQTRLLRKLRATVDEFCARIGQQAVVVTFVPSKMNTPNQSGQIKVFGSPQLEMAVMKRKNVLVSRLDNTLQRQAPPPVVQDASLHELPPLVCDGIPTPLDKMTQAQLRTFIPIMLKYSVERPKPGWGKDDLRPSWWPAGVPWQNVRSDVRPEEEKSRVPWTEVLRQIIRNCYAHHGRLDLLPEMSDGSDEPSAKRRATGAGLNRGVGGDVGEAAVIIHDNPSVVPGLTAQQLQQLPPNTQLIQQINTDGTISYLAVDLSDPNTAAIVAQAQAQAVLVGGNSNGSSTINEAVNQVDGPAAAPVTDSGGSTHITTEVLASSGDPAIVVSSATGTADATQVIDPSDIVDLPAGTAVLIGGTTSLSQSGSATISIDALAHAYGQAATTQSSESAGAADVLVGVVQARQRRRRRIQSSRKTVVFLG